MIDVQICRARALVVQVCAPMDATNEEIEVATNARHPSGTTHGWKVLKDGDSALDGDHSRVTCEADPKRVHVVLGV